MKEYNFIIESFALKKQKVVINKACLILGAYRKIIYAIIIYK